MCGLRRAGNNMQVATKYLRLRTPVTLGSRFGDWQVCWLGGWEKHQMYYLVMLVRVTGSAEKPRERCAAGHGGAGDGQLPGREAVDALAVGAFGGLNGRPHHLA